MIQISPVSLTLVFGAGFLLLGKWAAAARYYKDIQRPYQSLGWHGATPVDEAKEERQTEDPHPSAERMFTRHLS